MILGLSIDDEPGILRDHLDKTGWTKLRQLWCGEGEPGWNCVAAQTYGIRGVPTVLLVDQNGRIVLRGHTTLIDVEAKIDTLLAQAE